MVCSYTTTCIPLIQSSVSELRSQCAHYIKSHSDDFLPYLTDPDTGDQFTTGKLDVLHNMFFSRSYRLYLCIIHADKSM